MLYLKNDLIMMFSGTENSPGEIFFAPFYFCWFVPPLTPAIGEQISNYRSLMALFTGNLE